ncbi:MAG: PAS domain S-box protein [Deltaproteobacteria bacterium]|jgi:two-component system, NtrC family, sensor histidine kinase HydH|nr:PAS domain S-box protein [Deltaproteobacteria bacterium]MBT7715553.1 PAS domain S-box protein [Deltaproteobacteria bacterium]
MANSARNKISKATLPPLIVIGAVLVLLPIFVFVILQNINRQESFGTQLLLEKGAALIRSFEAGTRAGMMGRGWGNRRLQQLLSETAQQPDIAYLLLVDSRSRTIAHNNFDRIGKRHQPLVDQEKVSQADTPLWRFVVTEQGEKIFEVYKSFRPSRTMGRGPFHEMMRPGKPGRGDGRPGRMKMFSERFGFTPSEKEFTEPFVPTIILGFNLQTLEAARADDRNRAIIRGFILFLVSAFGIIVLFLFYNYRSARSSLSRIKAFSENLVDNMPIGLVAFNSDHLLTSVNSFAASLLNLKTENMAGVSADSILPPSLWEQVQNHISHPETVEKEIDCRLSSGRLIPLEIDISQFKSEDEGPLSYILMLKDLSQVKALQKEILRSQRLASIGSLAAGVAHEIRNPLSSIKGFATYFKERYPDMPQDQKIARIMIEEVERLNRVVGQLLELSKPVVISAKHSDLNILIDDSLKLIEQAAAAKNIEISAPHEPLGNFTLDSDKIKQVLLNLYLNAVEAMPDGGRLGVLLDLGPGRDRLDISVTDTGVGITRENLAKIVDPYFTTKQSGTGLGLVVVHNIIEAHGGKLTVESQPGKGSRFVISVPDLSGEFPDEQ